MKNKILKSVVLIVASLLFAFACKHDKGGGQGTQKALVLSSFKVDGNTYDKEAKTILVTKSALREDDIKEIVFTDKDGNAVADVNWKMSPDVARPGVEGKNKFKIVVKTPPQGYEAFESDEITVTRELVAPTVSSIKVHGRQANTSGKPFTVRIPKPTVAMPTPGMPGGTEPEIVVTFDRDVPPTLVSYEGLPQAANPLTPEETAHVTIKVAEQAGKWKAGEYKLDITFETPSLSLTELKVAGQDGDTDLSELKDGKVSLMVENNKEKVEKSDITTIKFGGDYISTEELNKITTATIEYEGLPLNNLEVSVPRTFKLKVPAKDKVYKAFEATVTVTRANKPLTLVAISVFDNPISDISNLDNLKTSVQTTTTFIKGEDIKATFTKQGSATQEVIPCRLVGGEKVALKAGVENDIAFKVLATADYAEYRGTVKVKHEADYKHMIKLPMPQGGAKWKTGSKDDKDISLNRKVEIGQFPVTYKLWQDVVKWAKSQAGQDKGYKNIEYLERVSRNGSIRSKQDEKEGAGHTGHPDNVLMPVCNVTYHGALVWCNAYSEMNNKAPCYYSNKAGEIETTWKPNFEGKYDLSCQTVKITAEKEAINKLALRDALAVFHPTQYDKDIWENIRDNYIKVAVLTAEQAKCDSNVETGFRLMDSVEWELAAKLRLTAGENAVPNVTLIDNGKTYYFGNHDCAAGSEGYGESGAEVGKVAWCRINSRVGEFLQTHLIGQKRPTDLGFYDLSGNVSSWTNTWGKYNGSKDEDVWAYAIYAVGGGFAEGPESCTFNSTASCYDAPYDQTGLRLARTLK